METIYGDINEKYINEYLTKLTNSVYKILPMSEEDCTTIEKYIKSLSREIFGNSKIFFNKEFLSISGTLNGLNLDSHTDIRSDVLKMCRLIEDMQKRFL